MVLPIIFVAAYQGQGGDARAQAAQDQQRLRPQRAIEQMDLTQPCAVVAHATCHLMHFVGRAEVLQGHAGDELEPQAHGLHHGHVGVFVAVAEVQPRPQHRIISQLIPENYCLQKESAVCLQKGQLFVYKKG